MDKGLETTRTVTDEGRAQRMAGRNAGMATAKGEVTQRAHMPQMAEPHMTVGKGHKTSHHDPRQHRQPDGPQKVRPDADAMPMPPKGPQTTTK